MATPNYSLWLSLFNASGEPFIASDDLRDAAVPELNDEIRPGTDRWLTLTHRRSQATLAESAVTRMWRVHRRRSRSQRRCCYSAPGSRRWRSPAGVHESASWV